MPAETGSYCAPNPCQRPRPWEEKFADGSGIIHLPDGSMLCAEARPDRVPMLPRPGAPVNYNDPPPKRKVED